MRKRWMPAAAAAVVAVPYRYSIGQQLLTTVWNIVLAAVLVVVVFGRSGGKRLVEESSTRARGLRPQGDEAVLRGGARS